MRRRTIWRAMLARRTVASRTPHVVFLTLLAVGVAFGSGCTSAEEEDAPPKADYVAKRMVHPKAGAFLIAAQDAFRAGHFAGALAGADSAEAYAPDLPDIPFLRGLVYTELRRFQAADSAYREVVALDPDYKGVWMNLGNNAFRQGLEEQALQHYRRAERAHPSPEVYLRLGYAYENLNRVDSARWAYEHAVEADSQFAPGYARLGQLLSRDGAFEEALVHARKALRLAQDDVDYQYFTGYLLMRTGAPEEAAPYLRRVVEARPWHYGAHYNLGQAYMQLQQPERAQSLLARADTLQNLDAEINQLQQRAGIYRDEPGVWIDLGDALHRSGRKSEALDAYRVALHLDSDNLELHNNVATLALMSGNAREAVARYRAVLQRDSTLADVWLNLGIAHAAAGQIEPARAAWRSALRHRPGHPAARRYLARYSNQPSES